MRHSSSSPKSSTDVTQPTGEEGPMRSDSDDSTTHTSPQIPKTSLSTTSNMSVTMEDDQPLEEALETSIQGNVDAANPRMLLFSKKLLIPMISSRTWLRENNVDRWQLEDKTKESREIVGEKGGSPESESLEAQDPDAEAEAFKLSGKTGEEYNKFSPPHMPPELGGEEMKGSKDNSVAVPQEIAMKAALTHTTKQKHSTASPKSSIDATQPTGEEGKMLSDSDDFPYLRSLLAPLSTVSDMSVSMEDALPVEQPLETSIQENGDTAMPRTRIDLNLKKPVCVGDDEVIQEILLKEIAYRRALNDFLTNSIEGNVDLGQIKELKEIVGEEAFELSGKTGEEDNKNIDDLNELDGEEMKGLKVGHEQDLSMYPFLKASLQFDDKFKENSVAISQEIAMKIALTQNRMNNSKLRELDEEWKHLLAEELEFQLKRLDLMSKQAKFVLDAIKSSSPF